MNKDIVTKKCGKCDEKKELLDFHKSKARKDGHQAWCKACQKEERKEYWIKNKEHLSAINKEYRLLHPVCSEKSKERNNERSRKYRKTAKSKDRSKTYREENRDKIAKQTKRYREANKVKLQEWHKEYAKTLRGQAILANARNKRRYLVRNSKDGTLPTNIKYPLSEELEHLLSAQNNQCNNCKGSLEDGKHLDHHIPLSKGGVHSIDNVVWLCPACNMSKSNKVPDTLLLVGSV